MTRPTTQHFCCSVYCTANGQVSVLVRDKVCKNRSVSPLTVFDEMGWNLPPLLVLLWQQKKNITTKRTAWIAQICPKKMFLQSRLDIFNFCLLYYPPCSIMSACPFLSRSLTFLNIGIMLSDLPIRPEQTAVISGAKPFPISARLPKYSVHF